MDSPTTDSGALRLGSLCTGYGGLDIAVRSVFGGDLAWGADNDPGAARILAHHHHPVPNLGDITTTDWTTVAPVDVVLGRYPCQPFSTADKRKGTTDARHIWPHIADALRVLRPRYAVFENVAGHLSVSTPSCPTLPPSGSMRSGALFARPMSVPPISATACSSFMWTTCGCAAVGSFDRASPCRARRRQFLGVQSLALASTRSHN